MKSLEMVKDHEDLRPNRKMILKKGTQFQCLAPLAEEYLKKKIAKEIDPEVVAKAEQKEQDEAEGEKE